MNPHQDLEKILSSVDRLPMDETMEEIIYIQ